MIYLITFAKVLTAQFIVNVLEPYIGWVWTFPAFFIIYFVVSIIEKGILAMEHSLTEGSQ
jgi:hypothetical protein